MCSVLCSYQQHFFYSPSPPPWPGHVTWGAGTSHTVCLGIVLDVPSSGVRRIARGHAESWALCLAESGGIAPWASGVG